MKLDPLFMGKGNSPMNITFDLGLMVKIFSYKINRSYNIGFSILNVTQPDIGLKSKDIVPMSINVGFAIPIKIYDFMKVIKMKSPVFVGGLSFRDKDFNLHFGWENSFINELLFFRLGSTLLDFSTGLGFKYSIGHKYDILLDYGFILPYKIDGTSGKHLISLKFRF